MKRFLSIIALTLTVNASVTAQTHPYQNTSLTARERATDLCSRLTLEEKAMLMLDESPAIPRMGIIAYHATLAEAYICIHHDSFHLSLC